MPIQTKMNYILPILFLLLSLQIPYASSKPSMAIMGVTINIARDELVRLSDSIVSIFGGEIITDSNTVIIHAGTKPFVADAMAIKSLKCLFNRKKKVQAVNITLQVENIDALIRTVDQIENIFGRATIKPEKIGYSSELEWKNNKKFNAFLFSSVEQSETYFLFATPSFMKEENERSKYAK